MIFQTDDLQEALFVLSGLEDRREFEQNQVDWCSNNREEHQQRYGDMFTVEDSIESHSSNVKKIDGMIDEIRSLIHQLVEAKMYGATPPPEEMH